MKMKLPRGREAAKVLISRSYHELLRIHSPAFPLVQGQKYSEKFYLHEEVGRDLDEAG